MTWHADLRFFSFKDRHKPEGAKRGEHGITELRLLVGEGGTSTLALTMQDHAYQEFELRRSVLDDPADAASWVARIMYGKRGKDYARRIEHALAEVQPGGAVIVPASGVPRVV